MVAHVQHNSGQVEWYTPGAYVDAARRAMGGIDLDPASCAEANEIVGAAHYYTAEDDGLILPWFGRVWLNPPYRGRLIACFVDKLIYHYAAGDVIAACVLVNNATETAWFQRLISVSTAIVLFRGRIRFWQVGGVRGTPLQGQTIIYFGPNKAIFADAFRQFGACLSTVRI